jgi:hypothetical protein
MSLRSLRVFLLDGVFIFPVSYGQGEGCLVSGSHRFPRGLGEAVAPGDENIAMFTHKLEDSLVGGTRLKGVFSIPVMKNSNNCYVNCVTREVFKYQLLLNFEVDTGWILEMAGCFVA